MNKKNMYTEDNATPKLASSAVTPGGMSSSQMKVDVAFPMQVAK
jgi:hypothetical protein